MIGVRPAGWLSVGHVKIFNAAILLDTINVIYIKVCVMVLLTEHILIECADLLEILQKYFEEKSLYSLVWNVIPEIIFDFLREIGVFYKILNVLRKCLCEVFLKSCLIFFLCGMFYNLFNE